MTTTTTTATMRFLKNNRFPLHKPSSFPSSNFHSHLPWLPSTNDPQKKSPTNSKNLTNSTVLNAIQKENNPRDLLRIYTRAATQKGFKHDYLTYKTLATKLGLQSRFKALDLLLNRMKLEGVKCYSGIFVNLIGIYVNAGFPTKAIDLLCAVPSYGCDSCERVFRELLDLLVRSGNLDIARSLFDDEVVVRLGFSIKARHYIVLVNAYFDQRSDVGSAIRLLELLSSRGCVPDLFCYGTIINDLCCCPDVNHVDYAFAVLDQMQRSGRDPDLVIYNMLINGLCRKGEIERAKGLLADMECRGVRGDVITYNTLIGGICRSCSGDDRIKNSLKVFYEMLRRRIYPDVITFSTLISCFYKEGKVFESRALLGKMLGMGIVPDASCYNIFLRGLCQKGMLDDAFEILREIEMSCFMAKEIAYEIVLESVGVFWEVGQVVLVMALKRGFLDLFMKFTAEETA